MASAFDDNASLQNTGSASFLGSNVSPIIELCSGRPTSTRLGIVARTFIPPAKRVHTPLTDHLDGSLTPPPPTLTLP